MKNCFQGTFHLIWVSQWPWQMMGGQAVLFCLREEEMVAWSGEEPVLGHSIDYLMNWNQNPDLFLGSV